MQVRRREYREQEHAWKDDQVIKVVTGMRRAAIDPVGAIQSTIASIGSRGEADHLDQL